MKKAFYLFCLLFTVSNSAQTLVASYPFPRYNYYDYFWGITQKDNDFWVTTNYNYNQSDPARFYKITKTGVILDSIALSINNAGGAEFDGTDFWIAKNSNKIYRVAQSGEVLDSIIPPNLNGQAALVGDLAMDGSSKLWYTVFSPDFVSYPNCYAFCYQSCGLYYC